MKKPPALKKGDTIGVMAPSSRVDKKTLAKAVTALKARGFNVYVHPQTFAADSQSAGTGKQKAKALHDLYKNPRIKAIFAARGGNRAGTMLEHLDFRLIRKHPKILMGFSDVTALLNAVNHETGQVTFHGPVLQSLGQGKIKDKQISQCFNLLGGGAADMDLRKGKILSKGKAEGKLVGGNLSILCSLLGTPWEPDFRGKILFVEDCNEELSRLDRLFTQLRNAGALAKISGLVIGPFTGTKDTGKTPFGFTLADIVREAVKGYDIPVVMNAPFGHGKDLYTLPVGAKARLNADKTPPALRLTGRAVRP